MHTRQLRPTLSRFTRIVPKHRPTYADDVIKAVRTAIVRGTLLPGQRLSEPDLARQLGVSRTPVREAIRALEQEGLVQRTPGRGISVVEITINDVEDIYAIKSVLEGAAVHLACRRATDSDLDLLYRYTDQMAQLAEKGDINTYAEVSLEFHEALVREARSRRLLEIYRVVALPIQRLRVYALSHPERPSQSVREHRAIIDAMVRRDPEEAERLIRSHVGGAGTLVAKMLHERALKTIGDV